MKKLLTGIFILTFLNACMFNTKTIKGNGNISTEERQLTDFSAITVSGNMEVIVDQGPELVKIEADENLIPYINSVISKTTLQIDTKSNFNLKSENPIRVFITCPELAKLAINGSGNITCNNKITNNSKLVLAITGSGNIVSKVHVPEINAYITGSGKIKVEGETKNLAVNITGSGKFSGFELKTENSEIKIQGSGEANVFADVKLKASIAGSGDINYKGNATIQSSIAGSGKISSQN